MFGRVPLSSQGRLLLAKITQFIPLRMPAV